MLSGLCAASWWPLTNSARNRMVSRSSTHTEPLPRPLRSWLSTPVLVSTMNILPALYQMPSPRLMRSAPSVHAWANVPLSWVLPTSRETVRGDRVEVRVGNVDPLQRVLGADRGGDQVGVRHTFGARGLQAATVFQRTGTSAAIVGNEAIQAGLVAVVFGQVDVAGARIDRHRFMAEAAERDQRTAGGAFRIRMHFEHVAVLAARARHRIGTDFLARQPGAPRSQAAGAIDDGATEAGFHAEEGAIAPSQRGGAAAGHQAAAEIAAVVHAGGADRIADRSTFVIADQHHFRSTTLAATIAANAKRETLVAHYRHAVVAVGTGQAVVHAVAAPAERGVAEAGWQLQQRQSGGAIGDRRERSIGAWNRREPGRVGGGHGLRANTARRGCRLHPPPSRRRCP